MRQAPGRKGHDRSEGRHLRGHRARGLDFTAPATAIALRVDSMISTASGTAAATDRLQPVLPTPQVIAPLALGLMERDPNWLVAGVSHFPDGGATLLRPDPAVMEATMLGANYAMLDEYLWRGFPTDRRGTPIRRFWPDQTDITPIDQWGTGGLGTHLGPS